MPLPIMAFIKLNTEEAKEAPLVVAEACPCAENTSDI